MTREDMIAYHRRHEPGCCNGCEECPPGCDGCSGCQRDCDCYEHPDVDSIDAEGQIIAWEGIE